ncbi:hypothetical protein B0T14DRAFT_44590 [Immersiella caudata]|uniref:Secreted protein n=1 Tax=Immersiella caudata TaxID=314043 RepID=A0AA39XF54_9PEZI|nr:hypothetical protein B0T14DRAFT_44590 [Immersiella caudata]
MTTTLIIMRTVMFISHASPVCLSATSLQAEVSDHHPSPCGTLRLNQPGVPRPSALAPTSFIHICNSEVRVQGKSNPNPNSSNWP